MNATDFEYAIKKDVRNNPIVRELDEARVLRLECGVVREQLRPLGVRRVEAQVQLKDGHVHEYDASEENPADRDPQDPAAGTGLACGADPRTCEGLRDGGHAVTPS